MRQELVQRVVDQRQEIEKQALQHLARVQSRLDSIQKRLDKLVHHDVHLDVSVRDMMVVELAEQRQNLLRKRLLQEQARVFLELAQAQDQLRDARADRCAADSIQARQQHLIKRGQRRREQRQLDDIAGAGHFALLRGGG